MPLDVQYTDNIEIEMLAYTIHLVRPLSAQERGALEDTI